MARFIARLNHPHLFVKRFFQNILNRNMPSLEAIRLNLTFYNKSDIHPTWKTSNTVLNPDKKLSVVFALLFARLPHRIAYFPFQQKGPFLMGTATTPTPPDDTGRFHIVEILKRRWLSKNAFEIELARPPKFEFKAGQTILLMHQSIKRYYSLLSGPSDANLTLCVHYVPEGQLSVALAKAEIGSQLNLTGPHGYFTFKPSSRKPVFIATGTGIAPFVSFARSGITGFTLLHQAISAEELYYQKYFQEHTSIYFSCLTGVPNAEPSLPNLFRGKISDCIRKNLRPGSYDFYLCGEREMIREVTLLVDEVYPESRVYTEVFY
jgi:ferredoxin-NADP reductase